MTDQLREIADIVADSLGLAKSKSILLESMDQTSDGGYLIILENWNSHKKYEIRIKEVK